MLKNLGFKQKFLSNYQISKSAAHVLEADILQKLTTAVKTGVPSVVVDVIYSVPSLKTIFKANILQELNEKCTELCKKNTPSILRKNQYPDMVGFDWNSILNEISQRCPLLLDVLATTIGSKLTPKTIPSICLCYGILMQKRNHDLSLIQRINTILLAEGNAKKQVG